MARPETPDEATTAAYCEAAGFASRPQSPQQLRWPACGAETDVQMEAALSDMLAALFLDQAKAVKSSDAAIEGSEAREAQGVEDAEVEEADAGDADIYRDYDAGPCSLLVVTFAAHANSSSTPRRFQLVGSARRAGASHVLALKDSHCAGWYLRGIHGAPQSFAAVEALVAREVDGLQPARVLLTGSSLGGYAACRTTLELLRQMPSLSSCRCLVFCPQAFIDPNERRLLELPEMWFDSHLRALSTHCRLAGLPMDSLVRCVRELHRCHARGPGDRVGAHGPNSEPAAAPRCHVDVHVGMLAAGDVREAQLLRLAAERGGGGVRVCVHLHPASGHALVADLHEADELDAVFISATEGAWESTMASTLA